MPDSQLWLPLQSTFAHLALSRQQAYKPGGIWHAFKDYDGEPINVREHQDAQEFLTRLQVHLSCIILSKHCLLSWSSCCACFASVAYVECCL